MGTFGLSSWLPLAVGERLSEVLSTLETCPQGNFYNVGCHGKMGRKGESGTFAHMFSHMLVLVIFNFQKVVYIGILGQLLKLVSFFPFKKCKLKNESAGIYFILD